jgi:hypothetical protein
MNQKSSPREGSLTLPIFPHRKQHMTSDNQREQLAALQHQIWSDWVRHMFEVSTANEDRTFTIPSKYVEQWQHQINTPYDALTEEEKDGDRKQVDKMLPLIDEQ